MRGPGGCGITALRRWESQSLIEGVCGEEGRPRVAERWEEGCPSGSVSSGGQVLHQQWIKFP